MPSLRLRVPPRATVLNRSPTGSVLQGKDTSNPQYPQVPTVQHAGHHPRRAHAEPFAHRSAWIVHMIGHCCRWVTTNHNTIKTLNDLRWEQPPRTKKKTPAEVSGVRQAGRQAGSCFLCPSNRVLTRQSDAQPRKNFVNTGTQQQMQRQTNPRRQYTMMRYVRQMSSSTGLHWVLSCPHDHTFPSINHTR